MSKDIWHTPPEQPDPFKSWNVLVVYEANDRKEMMYSTQFIHATDGMYVNRWCYLDDLLALETDLERTRKQLVTKCNQLEIAVDTLDRMAIHDSIYDIIARNAMKRIKELEQKEQQ